MWWCGGFCGAYAWHPSIGFVGFTRCSDGVPRRWVSFPAAGFSSTVVVRGGWRLKF